LSTPTQPDRLPSRYRVVGSLLMLPIGLVIALVLVYVFALRGEYYPGEFIFALIAIFAVLFVVRMLFRTKRRNYWRERYEANAPVRILRQRYARGEITQEQFRQMLRDIRRSRGQGPVSDSE
jgi:uncharacterized membrane protein